MRIFCLMQVESSLAGYVITDSSRISPSSSDDGTSFTIKSSKLIGAVTFLALFQSRLTRVDLSFSPHAMTLKIFFLVDLFDTAVSFWVRSLYGFCAMQAALCRLYVFCVRIQLVRSKRFMLTNTSFARNTYFAYVYNLCALSRLCV